MSHNVFERSELFTFFMANKSIIECFRSVLNRTFDIHFKSDVITLEKLKYNNQRSPGIFNEKGYPKSFFFQSGKTN